jgi:CRP-like cAMP-binding protein
MGSFRQSQNDLLAALPGPTFELLRPHLRTVKLVAGTVLAQAGTRPPQVYFPHSGMISKVLTMAGGEAIEVAMIGRDGQFGAWGAIDDVAPPTSAVVRFPGGASVIEAAHFRAGYENSAELRAALTHRQRAELVMAEQTAACNAAHGITERLCRRLLAMHRLAGCDDLPLTQETLAQTLGVRRNSVSLAAIALQRAGLVRYSRGRIRILEPDGLMRLSCECYLIDLAQRRPGAGDAGDVLIGAPAP